MREHEVNRLNNFIMGWYAEDTTFCDKLIDIFNKNKDRTVRGSVNKFGTVDTNFKDSTDLNINLDHFNDMYYAQHLRNHIDAYLKRWDRARCNGMYPAEGFNIQHYSPGGGFKAWHSEKESADEPQIYRHLVFMTYLNTLEDGGTEFLYQDVKIKAEKGLTVIWPAEWMFAHKGQISNTSEKWIATGWMHLYKTKDVQIL
jgi:hypothetical protein